MTVSITAAGFEPFTQTEEVKPGERTEATYVLRKTGANEIVVRGSKAWDSRIYVDEIQIPQLFHFAGVVATFNSANLEAIAFQPGNFSVDYGRSIGGLITSDVKTLITTSRRVAR